MEYNGISLVIFNRIKLKWFAQHQTLFASKLLILKNLQSFFSFKSFENILFFSFLFFFLYDIYLYLYLRLIEKEMEKLEKSIDVFVEINTSGEESIMQIINHFLS